MYLKRARTYNDFKIMFVCLNKELPSTTAAASADSGMTEDVSDRQ